MASAQMISHWINSAREPACRRSPGLRITPRVASGCILFLECRDTTSPNAPTCSDTANFLKKKRKKKKRSFVSELLFTRERILQATRAYLDRKVSTLIGFFFLHPERIRRHSIQTLNPSIRTSPLTVNFTLSAFTWPIKPQSALMTLGYVDLGKCASFAEKCPMKDTVPVCTSLVIESLLLKAQALFISSCCLRLLVISSLGRNEGWQGTSLRASLILLSRQGWGQPTDDRNGHFSTQHVNGVMDTPLGYWWTQTRQCCHKTDGLQQLR